MNQVTQRLPLQMYATRSLRAAAVAMRRQLPIVRSEHGMTVTPYATTKRRKNGASQTGACTKKEKSGAAPSSSCMRLARSDSKLGLRGDSMSEAESNQSPLRCRLLFWILALARLGKELYVRGCSGSE